MSNNSVSVIIVNYNTIGVLEKCLENLFSLETSLQVIVVDNASSDGSAEMVRTKFPPAALLPLTENRGLAYGYNRGLEKATGQYILLLGSDAFPEKGTIAGLVRFLEENTSVGLATGRLVLRDGHLDWDAHRGFPTPWKAFTHFSGLEKLFPSSRLFGGYFLGWEDLDKPHEIDLCISHFMLIRKIVIETVGHFDEEFFVYGEDVDFCYRVKQAGWKIMYLPAWPVTHWKGVSVGLRKETQDVTKASPETRLRMTQETSRVMQVFYRKHYFTRYPKVITGLILGAINYLGKIRELRNRDR